MRILNFAVGGRALNPRSTAAGKLPDRRSLHVGCVAIISTVLAAFALMAGTAQAEEALSPWWHLSSTARPTFLQPGHEDEISVIAANIGDANVMPQATPVKITDQLPEGLEAVAVEASVGEGLGQEVKNPIECSLSSAQEASCTYTGAQIVETELWYHYLPPNHQILVRIWVKVKSDAHTGELNRAVVTGGGAAPVSATQSLTVSAGPTPFGITSYEMRPEEAGGAIDTQAGSHPFQFTTSLALTEVPGEREPEALEGSGLGRFVGKPVSLSKDLHFNLPAGLIGNPNVFPHCTLAQFLTPGPGFNSDLCPPQTALGVARVSVSVPGYLQGHEADFTLPLFNIEPAVGEPARFGFLVYGEPVLLDTAVRTGGDYGVTVEANNITQSAEFRGSEVTFWGVPGDPRHDSQRGWGCLELSQHVSVGRSASEVAQPCAPLGESQPPPFLVLPTSCSGALQSTMEGDTWSAPGKPSEVLNPLGTTVPLPALDGCNRLGFEPSVKVTPDGAETSKPTGLNVDVHVNQASVLSGTGIAESDVRNITVALPEGVAVNPAGGDGLEACSSNPGSAAQAPGNLIGFKGFGESSLEPGVSNPLFTPTLPGSHAALEAGETQPFEPGINFCADASKIGEATIHSPLLPNPLKGFVYLAAQNENPFGSLIAMYIVAEDTVSGTLVKLPGVVHLTSSGQIVSTFENNPQLPFEDAELHFFGGERAPLSSPSRCGAYTTSASFTPWSGDEAVDASAMFDITSGPNGRPCPGAALPFSPSLTGGTVNINAGSFSPLTTTIGREDGQQDLQSVQLHMPAGLSGILAGVKLCDEADANAGTCGPESEIGETTVAAGVGSDPVTVKGGRVYITEKYGGAPFGLSIVNPVKAGPFDLERDTANPGQNPACDCVVVRAKIEVDPTTSALTVTTDASGPHAIPHLIDGIPVQIKRVNVLVNGAGGDLNHFTFNPTNCNKMEITGQINSGEGASSAVKDPFQVTNCKSLAFAPKFAVSTSGKTSKAKGASLHVSLSYPGPFTNYANIAKAKVELPKALPSRLTTLQKACTNAQFEANPANCPAASKIGYAKAVTPLLPVPLEGPAIFVSHGGEAFPSLEFVLQGYGVTIDLVGTTFISKSGITSTTFKQVPDQPVTSFELTLPEGKFSALAANGNLCKQKLVMPNEFIAQNGAEIHQVTPISVTGCKKTLSRSAKLRAAMKACHRDHSKGKRTKCEKAARRKFGTPAKKARKLTHAKRRSS